MLTAHNPTGMAWRGLSQGVCLKGSGIFVSSGQVGLAADGDIETSSMRAQVVAMFEAVKNALAEAGLGFENVARTTCYARSFDPEFMATFKEVRAQYYNMDCPPASVMVQAGLYDNRLWAEMEVIAVIP